MTTTRLALAIAAALLSRPALAAPVVLTNHLGYDREGPKRAVIQGRAGDEVRSCAVEELESGARLPAVLQPVGPVAKWRDWTYWTVEFSDLRREGTFRLACATSAGEQRSF